jgi:hypothetical protein
MIRWAENLYLSEDINVKKKKKMMKAIEKGKLTFELYCITFASNPNNLFDILNANELLFPYYARQEIFVLGLAESKDLAKLLVKDMIVEVYNSTGGFGVRDYFAYNF